ncbi:unnamed protein product [Protopolystoma xenopodis]|uniref:Uncharacterized protein n=1 Tax=Protopolystoma xenopodis TaxID=117903 RepID=A0A448WE38_9PLAT|nr:unnamed protein product [Protopolystoma xenopodis]
MHASSMKHMLIRGSQCEKHQFKIRTRTLHEKEMEDRQATDTKKMERTFSGGRKSSLVFRANEASRESIKVTYFRWRPPFHNVNKKHECFIFNQNNQLHLFVRNKTPSNFKLTQFHRRYMRHLAADHTPRVWYQRRLAGRHRSFRWLDIPIGMLDELPKLTDKNYPTQITCTRLQKSTTRIQKGRCILEAKAPTIAVPCQRAYHRALVVMSLAQIFHEAENFVMSDSSPVICLSLKMIVILSSAYAKRDQIETLTVIIVKTILSANICAILPLILPRLPTLFCNAIPTLVGCELHQRDLIEFALEMNLACKPITTHHGARQGNKMIFATHTGIEFRGNHISQDQMPVRTSEISCKRTLSRTHQHSLIAAWHIVESSNHRFGLAVALGPYTTSQSRQIFWKDTRPSPLFPPLLKLQDTDKQFNYRPLQKGKLSTMVNSSRVKRLTRLLRMIQLTEKAVMSKMEKQQESINPKIHLCRHLSNHITPLGDGGDNYEVACTNKVFKTETSVKECYCERKQKSDDETHTQLQSISPRALDGHRSMQQTNKFCPNTNKYIVPNSLIEQNETHNSLERLDLVENLGENRSAYRFGYTLFNQTQCVMDKYEIGRDYHEVIVIDEEPPLPPNMEVSEVSAPRGSPSIYIEIEIQGPRIENEQSESTLLDFSETSDEMIKQENEAFQKEFIQVGTNASNAVRESSLSGSSRSSFYRSSAQTTMNETETWSSTSRLPAYSLTTSPSSSLYSGEIIGSEASRDNIRLEWHTLSSTYRTSSSQSHHSDGSRDDVETSSQLSSTSSHTSARGRSTGTDLQSEIEDNSSYSKQDKPRSITFSDYCWEKTQTSNELEVSFDSGSEVISSFGTPLSFSESLIR